MSMREALKPFADLASFVLDYGPNARIATYLTVSDIRRAAEVYAALSGAEKISTGEGRNAITNHTGNGTGYAGGLNDLGEVVTEWIDGPVPEFVRDANTNERIATKDMRIERAYAHPASAAGDVEREALAEKIRTLQEPDRAVDLAICEAVGLDCRECCGRGVPDINHRGECVGEECCGNPNVNPPAFTAYLAAPVQSSVRKEAPAKWQDRIGGVMSEKLPPHMNDFNGACSEKGRFKLQLITEGPPRARDLRNICRFLELTAQWLEEDERVSLPATKET